MDDCLHQKTFSLYPLSNYTFGVKGLQADGDFGQPSDLQRLSREYKNKGIRRTVEGVLLVHDHGHPHILLLQAGLAFFKLPGGPLNPGEDEVSGLSRILTETLAPDMEEPVGWHVGECIAVWWRPNFEMFIYPYVPPHVTRPKEERKIYLVHLPAKSTFAVPRNLKLVAVPLFELYDNTASYGHSIASLPHLVSRFQMLHCSTD